VSDVGPGRRRGGGWLAAVGAGLVIAVVLAAGVLVWGRVADTPTVAMVLTTAWFAVVLALAALLARRRRWLLLPLGAGYGVAAIATGVLVALPTVVGRTVNDSDPAGVAAAVPAAAPGGDSAIGTGNGTPTPADPSRSTAGAAAAVPVELGRANLAGIDHRATGTARLIRLADGSVAVRLESLDVQPGPDYYLHVLAGPDMHRPAGGSQVARLRGTRGNQNYPLAAGRTVALPATVLIWCRAFDTPIAAATIR
jgi:hypothetical protein